MRRRSESSRPLETVERVCVVVVLAALIAMLVWMAIHAGGGVLNQG